MAAPPPSKTGCSAVPDPSEMSNTSGDYCGAVEQRFGAYGYDEFKDKVDSENESSSFYFVDTTNDDDLDRICPSGENSQHVAGSFEDAIGKNKCLQALLHSKMLKLEAKIKEVDKLAECVRNGRPMQMKPDACLQLVCLPKIRVNARVQEDDSVPAMHKGPPENLHVSCYKAAMEMFPVGLRQMEWSKGESENLLKGLKQQFQAMLINGSCDDSDDIDSIMCSIKDFDITPEKIRLFLPKVDWDRLSAVYVPSRSGAECQSRYLNCEDPLINKSQWTAEEDKKLLRIVQQKGISNWLDIAVSLRTKRTPFQCLARYQRSLNASILKREWAKEEDEQLQAAVETYGESNWLLVASVMEGRTGIQCSNRWLRTLNPARERVGRWTAAEDKRLRIAVTLFGPKRWKKVADYVPGRTQVQCRERWVNSLDPSVNMGRWTQEEDSKLKAAILQHGCLWNKVSTCVPGRTDNQCWRRWKVLFPNEVHPRQAARKIQKAALISNFVGRQSERPLLGPSDFIPINSIPDVQDGVTGDTVDVCDDSDPNEECRLASGAPAVQGVTVDEEAAGLCMNDATRKKASKLQPRRKRVNPRDQVPTTIHEEGDGLGKHDGTKTKASKLQPRRKRVTPSDQVPTTTHKEGAGLGKHDAAKKKASKLESRKRAKPSDQLPATTHEEGAGISISEDGSGLAKHDATQNRISSLHPCRKRAKPSPQDPDTRHEEEVHCIPHVPEYRYEEEMRIWYESVANMK